MTERSRKCDDSASVVKYQIEYTWADDGKAYIEWQNTADLKIDDPLETVETLMDVPHQLSAEST